MGVILFSLVELRVDFSGFWCFGEGLRSWFFREGLESEDWKRLDVKFVYVLLFGIKREEKLYFLRSFYGLNILLSSGGF